MPAGAGDGEVMARPSVRIVWPSSLLLSAYDDEDDGRLTLGESGDCLILSLVSHKRVDVGTLAYAAE